LSAGDVDPSRLMAYVLALRQNGVTDARVLAAMERRPRSAFAPAAFASLALADRQIPIGEGQFSPRPSEAARLVSALDVRADHKVLEIGAGSGFITGVLAAMARKVTAVERRRALVSHARACLGQMRIMNAHVHHGDGLLGWREEAPFDRMILHGAAPPFVSALIAQLAPGGLMLAAAGLAPKVHWRVFENVDGALAARADLGPADVKPLEPGVAEA
jgi:protein-L-isoaspartate(D-aspartate) O-methyltransferase